MSSNTFFLYIALFLGVSGAMSLLGHRLALLSRYVTMVLLGLGACAAIYKTACTGLVIHENSCFLLMTFLIGLAATCHAGGYLADSSRSQHRFFWLFFTWTLCAMLMVQLFADIRIGFITAWELMGLFSFALVIFEYHEVPVRRAGWIYLLSCEAGGLLLMLGLFHDSSAFTSWSVPENSLTPYLLLAGFGLKAGLPLLHFWLPEAHPAAPAPVSALMSAAMIPLGFFGFFHFITPYYGHTGIAMTLVFSGMAGAFFGILSGLCCPNIKRLLAYSSVENIGIAAMGFGLAILGEIDHNPFMTACGFAGACLHLLNHALLKGSLFLAAGSVLKATGTLDMDRLGGLMKKMPLTGACFTASSLGICGLPPFCGFSGELLIYAAAFSGISTAGGCIFATSLLSAITLALAGAIACAAFAKSISAIFLGEPRHEEAARPTAEKRTLTLPIAILSGLAILMTFIAPTLNYTSDDPSHILGKYAIIAGIFYFMTAILLYARYRIGTDPRRSLGTWDCGYTRPSARMQYTGTAFVQPLADLFNPFLRQTKTIRKPDGYFPVTASISTSVQDFSLRLIYNPVARFLRFIAIQTHRLQAGYVHLYILVLVVALLILLGYGFHNEITFCGK